MFCNYIDVIKVLLPLVLLSLSPFSKPFHVLAEATSWAYVGEGQGQGTRIGTIGWAKVNTKWGVSTPCIGGIGGSR